MNEYPLSLSFEQAARMQYRYGSFYTVWLVSPATDGAESRVYLGCTQRKSMAGLIRLLARESVQTRVKTLPDAEQLSFCKAGGKGKVAGHLALSNGMRIEFGGTIRQETATK